MKSKKKLRIVIYSEFLIFLFFYKIFRLISLRAAYRVCSVVLLTWFYLDGKHRRRAISHLLHAGVASTFREAKAMAKENYLHYARLLIEVMKADQFLRRDNVREYFSVSGDRDAIDLFLNPEHPAQAIIVIAHYGNWEIAGAGYYFLTGRKLASIKRPLNNPLINNLVMRQREREGHEGVEKQGALRGMLRALKEGKTIAVLADQHASSNEGVETLFFGHPARTHSSPALLHLRTGVPIMVGVCRRRKSDSLKFEFVLAPAIRYTPTDDKDRDLRAITQMYTSELETLIRQEPEQWLWVHRRWLNINRGSSRLMPITPSDNG